MQGPPNVSFIIDSESFLGHIISDDEINVYTKEMEAMRKLA